MDKKQIHKIGKQINKPVKFVKKNFGWIATAALTIAGSKIVDKITEKD